MPSRTKLSQKGIKDLLLALFSLDCANQLRLRRYFTDNLGFPIFRDETEEISALKIKIAERMIEVIAGRLAGPPCRSTLVRRRDMDRIAAVTLKDLLTILPPGHGIPSRQIKSAFNGIWRGLFETLSKQLSGLSDTKQTPYQKFWSEINIVLGVAKKNGLTVKKLLARPDAYDILTRARYSKSHFVRESKKAYATLCSRKVIAAAMRHTVVNALKLVERDDALERELLAEVENDARELSEKLRRGLALWFNDEVKRIYG